MKQQCSIRILCILKSTISTPLWVGGNDRQCHAGQCDAIKNKTKTIQNYVANKICWMGCVYQTFGCSQESAGQFYMLEERLELLENTLENPAATGVEGQIVENVELCIRMHDQNSILIIVNSEAWMDNIYIYMTCDVRSAFQPV